MSPERWRKIKTLLDACAEMSADDRTTWLDEACANDLTLRAEVESYLVFEDELEALEAPPELLTATLAPSDEDELGRLVGPYRLDQLLGRGGMGAVYRAHRETEFEQSVALKLVRSGFETPTTLERFHNERQILARLEHPNIARLLDGGTTEDGRPYFVMELIDGLPIDRYCDEHRLNVRERVELVRQVCDALAFAHRNLVLHLDLKPGNILVTAEGVPKLLDFGIGKLLRRERELIASEGGPHPLTVSYASPDQLLGDPLSTSSDVYSLGVVLYELLTGRLPCSPFAKDHATLARAICRDPPRRPSTVVARPETVGLGDRREELGPSAVAETRERSPAALARRLRGDLDAISLRCLEKDPRDRYASAEQLSTDLGRHLELMPVVAREGGFFYRGSKFVRRNRWPLSAAAVLLAVILGFTTALSSQLRHTERQRQRSARLSEFLVELFRAAEPDRAGEQPSVRELVDLGRQRLETELAEEPEVRAELLGTLGRVYYRLGYYDAAFESHQTALGVFRQAIRGDHPAIAKTLNDLSTIAYARGDMAGAEAYCRQALAMRQRLGEDENLLKPRNNLASILLLRGKLEEAAAIHREILDHRRTHLGPRHPNVAVSLRNLATADYLAGDLDRAEARLRESLAIRIESFGYESTSVASALASLGRVAHARGELEEAERQYLEALRIRRRLLGDDHLVVGILEGDLARLMVELGELELAAILFDNAFRAVYRHKPEGDWVRADLESAYGGYLLVRGRLADAEPCLKEGRRILEAIRGPDVLPAREASRRLEAFRQAQAQP